MIINYCLNSTGHPNTKKCRTAEPISSCCVTQTTFPPDSLPSNIARCVRINNLLAIVNCAYPAFIRPIKPIQIARPTIVDLISDRLCLYHRPASLFISESATMCRTLHYSDPVSNQLPLRCLGPHQINIENPACAINRPDTTTAVTATRRASS